MENIFENDGRVRIAIIGEGAAGMMAAVTAAESGGEVIIFERNDKPGKKLRITGKGRCNVTSDSTNAELMASIPTNPKFMFASLSRFSSADTKSFFEEHGVPLKVERGKRVFPVSDKASDIVNALVSACRDAGVKTVRQRVTGIISGDGEIKGIKTQGGSYECDAVIICTGGKSYPMTGSDGDGYKFAKQFGHQIIDLRPGLVGIELKGSDFAELQGVSLKNVQISAKLGQKTIYSDFGEMLFTHFGVSGPIVLSCSSKINRQNLNQISLEIDLKPALTEQVLEARLIREFKENNTKNLGSTIRSLLPKALINVALRQAKVNPNKNCSEITTQERQSLIKALKGLTFEVKKLRPIEESIITAGGVSVKEINPKTMESKKVNGLYFAGEVLDVDAFTGGFNLQIAFATGWVAGQNS